MTIAKVDATLNDVPDEIQGFPTIKLFPAGGKDSPLDYSGSRTIEDLATFIKEKGKYQIDAYVAPEATADDEDSEMPDADKMGKVAPAASKKAEEAKEAVKDAAGAAKDTKQKVVKQAEEAKDGAKEKVKSKVSEAAEAVKTMVQDSDEDEHDEL